MDGEESVDLKYVKDCKYCDAKIVFVKSLRTNNFYPVNYHGEIGRSGKALVMRKDIHKCPNRPPICKPGHGEPTP